MQSIFYTKKGEIISVQKAHYYMKTLENADYVVNDLIHYVDIADGHKVKNKEDWKYLVNQEGFNFQIEGIPKNSEVRVLGQVEIIKRGVFTLEVEEAGEYVITVFPEAKYLAKEIKVNFV